MELKSDMGRCGSLKASFGRDFLAWAGSEGWTRYIRGTTTRKPLGRLISISYAGSQEVNYGCDRQVRDEA